jgi:hypothetical protein
MNTSNRNGTKAKKSITPFGNTDGYIKQKYHISFGKPIVHRFWLYNFLFTVMPRSLQYKLEAPSTCSRMVKWQLRENWQEETLSVFLNLLTLHWQNRGQNGERGSLNIFVLPTHLRVQNIIPAGFIMEFFMVPLLLVLVNIHPHYHF